MSRFIPILCLLVSCASERGDECTVDSDCINGLICSFDNVCSLPSSLISDWPEVGAPSSDARNNSTSDADDNETSSDSTQVQDCEPLKKAFRTQATPCQPVEKYDLSGIQLASEGHSFQVLANLGNEVISQAIIDGNLNIDAWVDGTLSPDCTFEIAWFTADSDRNSDCSPNFSDTFPLSIPAFANPDTGLNYIALIRDAKFDATTNRVSGYIIKSEFKAGLIPTFSDITDMLIEDVDTDQDDKPDALSIIVDLKFTLQPKNSK